MEQPLECTRTVGLADIMRLRLADDQKFLSVYIQVHVGLGCTGYVHTTHFEC